jgi:hypothetical protein
MMNQKMAIGLPDNLQLNFTGSGLEIVRKWFTWSTIFMTAFVIVWDGFLIIWYSIALGPGRGNLIMVLFPLIHVAAGVGLTYITLAGWVNTTRVSVDNGKLSVRHGPLPWIGNKDLDGSSLKQLYSKEQTSRGRNSTTVTYEVHAITGFDTNEKLVSGLESSEQALYIEQEIERHLGIEDVPVRGQL